MNQAEKHPIPEPEQSTNAPTTLHLFRNAAKINDLRTKYSTALQVEQRFNHTKTSLEKVSVEKNARIDRLDELGLELSAELDAIHSSITCGEVFLKMREELKDLSPQDFMSFFKLCLGINTHLSKVRGGDSEISFLKTTSAIKARSMVAEDKPVVDKVMDDTPLWFKGSKKDWREFAACHIHFAAYMSLYLPQEDSLTTNTTNSRNSIQDLVKRINTIPPRRTIQGEFPDWLLENNEEIPIKEEVEREIEQDKEQETKILEGLRRTTEQITYLDSSSLEKREKATARLATFVREQFADFQNFAELILVLKVFDSQGVNETAESNIRSFVENKNLVLSYEPIALYIEKKLRERKIVNSSQEYIGPSFMELFTDALEYIKAQKKGDDYKNGFQNLRTTDKNAFYLLNFDIKPFIELLSLDELSFLQELLNESDGVPVEKFIWDMASLVSSRFEDIGSVDNLSEKQRGAIYYLQRFTTSFLRNHLRWTYQQIREALDEDQNRETELAYQHQVVEEKTIESDSLQREIDNAIEELQQGNLMGWRIFYTDNRSLDTSHITEIGGRSLSEREEALQEFFVQKGISSSIKSGSIIRALEWIVGVPGEIEQIRMTKEIEGERFKKVKRGKDRIFYVLDKDQRTIVFFTHQKQAWTYGF